MIQLAEEEYDRDTNHCENNSAIKVNIFPIIDLVWATFQRERANQI